jgi:uncharacterized SAM-binding protein YcdF (DUF218 family)
MVATRNKRIFRYAAIVLVGSLCALYLFRAPILTGIGRYLVATDPLERADAIVILSGHGSVRGAKAAELYHQKWAPRILITKEGFPYRESEWARYGVVFPETDAATVTVLKSLAVPAADIEILDGYNDSTVEEAWRYLHYMQARGLNRLILVTSSFHTRRSRMIFRRVFRGSKISISAQPAAPEAEFNPDRWWKRRLDARTLFLEYEKLVFYALRYW